MAYDDAAVCIKFNIKCIKLAALFWNVQCVFGKSCDLFFTFILELPIK